MSNELATTQFEAMMAEAKTLVDSGFLPKAIRTPAQALAIMTMSKELGIGYWTGFNGINVISGKPTISPQLMLALIYKRHPEAVIQINGDAQSCTVFMQRKDGQSHTEVFTLEQASKIMTKEDDKVIPLTQKYNWRQQAAVMLKWRAVAACARVIFPDVIMGFYTPEEIEPDSQIEYETGELIQQHPALEAEIVQDANETRPSAPSATGNVSNDVSRAIAPQPRYSASGLRDAILASINKRADQSPDDLVVVSTDKARKLAIQWRTIMKKRDNDPEGWPVKLSEDDARYAVTEYLIGRMPKDDKDAPSFKGLSVVEHTVLDTWLSNASVARVEAEEVYAALTILPAGPDVGDGDNMPMSG